MNDQVQFPVLKLATAWIFATFGSWGEAAAFLAAIYSLALLSEWVFKKCRAIYFWTKARKADAE